MHCVFNKATALCIDEQDETPSLRQCRSNCSNIARTDDDIQTLKNEIDSLPTDPLAPEIRDHRINQVKATMTHAIRIHEGNADGTK